MLPYRTFCTSFLFYVSLKHARMLSIDLAGCGKHGIFRMDLNTQKRIGNLFGFSVGCYCCLNWSISCKRYKSCVVAINKLKLKLNRKQQNNHHQNSTEGISRINDMKTNGFCFIIDSTTIDFLAII